MPNASARPSFPFARIARVTPHRDETLCVSLTTPRGEERLVVPAKELLNRQRFEAMLLGRLGLMLEDSQSESAWRQVIAKTLAAEADRH